MAYIEHDLAWLVEHEFMEENGSGHSTSFLITDTELEQGEYAVYLKHKEHLSDVITRELAASEEAIRSIGFHGCGKPLYKLLWLLIYQFCIWLNIPYPAAERPVRMDGGKYMPLGFDRTDWDSVHKTVDTSGWAHNGSMHNDGFYWFGLYNFNPSEIEDMIDACIPEYENLHRLLITDLEAYYKGKLPGQLRHLQTSVVRQALGNLGFLSTFFAFQDGFLYRPTDKSDGEFLTLLYVKR